MSDESTSVLIVDDEPQVRDLAARALSAYKIDCDTAADGEEALRLVGRKPYDGVVTDLRMPRRHGHALCSDLANLPHPPRVIVMTALADARLVRDLLDRGVHDVVQKPVNYEVLATKVKAMLDAPAPRTAMTAPGPRKATAKRSNHLHRIESSLVELTDLFGERLDMVFETEGEMAEPPKSVREFIRRLAEGEAEAPAPAKSVVLPGHESRAKTRVTCYTTAIATPVDRHWRPVCEPFKLALRDLSESGCRLLHTRATNAEYVALCWNATQLVAKQVRVVASLKRCKPLGPFYDYGCQFVMTD